MNIQKFNSFRIMCEDKIVAIEVNKDFVREFLATRNELSDFSTLMGIAKRDSWQKPVTIQQRVEIDGQGYYQTVHFNRDGEPI